MSARVLLVDDLELNRKLLEAQLRREYYQVSSVASGLEALAAAKADQPDIILLDIMMPGMDGFEVCARLKADPATRHIPVVFVSALDERVDRLRGLELGADDFLTKPVDSAQLTARMRSLARLKIVTDELRLREAAGRQLGAIDGDPWRDNGLGARIVIVDDDTRRAAAIEAALGGQHLVVPVGRSAVSVGQARPDLILVTAAAAAFDGLRLIAGLRSSAASRNIPILALCDGDQPDAALRALDLGAHDVAYLPLDEDELAARVRTIVKRKRYVEAMRSFLDRGLEMAVTDQLTGLSNRRFLTTQLQGLVMRAARGGEPVSVILADIDHFKAINDTHGHDAGDEVLKALAARLSTSLRPADMACRFGGEEFVIIMPNTFADFAAMVAERLRRDVAAAPVAIGGGREIAVTASFGVAGVAAGDTAERLLKRADEALYRAKQAGRNRVVAEAA
ncbi:MAG: PleD family two-component system response regulator [Alphaproteobacteria bacterium]|nr:PleD family two-component system response regulator [Alphaproteobacteria bacterium]